MYTFEYVLKKGHFAYRQYMSHDCLLVGFHIPGTSIWSKLLQCDSMLHLFVSVSLQKSPKNVSILTMIFFLMSQFHLNKICLCYIMLNYIVMCLIKLANRPRGQYSKNALAAFCGCFMRIWCIILFGCGYLLWSWCFSCEGAPSSQ